MNYGTGMSGAYGSELAVGLVRNFGYSPSLRLMRREWFDLISWENMIYSDLKAGHPVYYDGVNGSNTGAHAFCGRRIFVGRFLSSELGLGRNEQRIFHPDGA